jgi:hypothetical protein
MPHIYGMLEIVKKYVADPGFEFIHPRSGSESKNLSILTPKKLFLSCRKYDLGCSSRIPDPDPDLFPIPDPGTGSATPTCG